MKKFKKIVALATAMAMALAPTVVSAATSTGASVTGGATSDGEFEGWIEKSVFSYTLPTQSNNAFDFIVDPQNLIIDSNDAQSTGAVTTGATGVYFKNGSGYAASSEALTVENMSSMPVDVTVEAKVTITSADSVKMVTAGAVTDSISNEAASLDLCIAVNQVTTGAVEYVDDSTKTATLTATMAALDADEFEIVADGQGYKYQAKGTSSAKETAKFYLTGSCNTAADWSAAKDMSAKLDLVWTVARGGAKEAYGLYNAQQNAFFLALTDAPSYEPFPSSATITECKVNGQTCPASFDSTTYSGYNYVKITGQDVLAVFGSFPSTYEIKFVVDGVSYVAHPTVN